MRNTQQKLIWTIVLLTLLPTSIFTQEREPRSLESLLSLLPNIHSGDNTDLTASTGLIGTLISSDVINNVIQTIFDCLELKINAFFALRNIFSFENVRQCLLILRKISNWLLRVGTFLNKFLPVLPVEKHGLGILSSFFPELPFGETPQQPSTAYGVPTTTQKPPEPPATSYGVPVKPTETYGPPKAAEPEKIWVPKPQKPAPYKPPKPVTPTSIYGAPAEDSKGFAETPSEAPKTYGLPAKASEAFVVSSEAPKTFSEYGVPSEASKVFVEDALPSEATKTFVEYGVPDEGFKTFVEYGVPSEPASVYGPPQFVYRFAETEKPTTEGWLGGKILFDTPVRESPVFLLNSKQH